MYLTLPSDIKFLLLYKGQQPLVESINKSSGMNICVCVCYVVCGNCVRRRNVTVKLLTNGGREWKDGNV